VTKHKSHKRPTTDLKEVLFNMVKYLMNCRILEILKETEPQVQKQF
jgi:hypothetical protein